MKLEMAPGPEVGYRASRMTSAHPSSRPGSARAAARQSWLTCSRPRPRVCRKTCLIAGGEHLNYGAERRRRPAAHRLILAGVRPGDMVGLRHAARAGAAKSPMAIRAQTGAAWLPILTPTPRPSGSPSAWTTLARAGPGGTPSDRPCPVEQTGIPAPSPHGAGGAGATVTGEPLRPEHRAHGPMSSTPGSTGVPKRHCRQPRHQHLPQRKQRAWACAGRPRVPGGFLAGV